MDEPVWRECVECGWEGWEYETDEGETDTDCPACSFPTRAGHLIESPHDWISSAPDLVHPSAVNSPDVKENDNG